MVRTERRAATWAVLCTAVVLGAAAPADAARPRRDATPLKGKAFLLPELRISTSNVPVQEVMEQLPNRAQWEGFAARRALSATPALHAYIDPRSGAASNILLAEPLIPGSGVGNTVTLASLGQRLGHPVTAVDAAVVGEATVLYVTEHAALLGLDPAELDAPRVTRINADLWQVSIGQVHSQVGLAPGRLVATISHGNLVTVGTATWITIAPADLAPALKAEDALARGFAFAEGRGPSDEIVQQPQLQLVAVAPPRYQSGERFTGPVGKGYGHRLVWSYRFQRRPDPATWEVMVDAHSGDVIAFVDRTHYATRQFTGGVYPLTNTETCPSNQSCGVMQDYPMPFADTGRPAPNDFTNSGGVYTYTGGGGATFRMNGRYFNVDSGSFPFVETSSSGGIALGGLNGQHDGETPDGQPGGNNPPSRTAFYELNKIAELGRGYLPHNPWLQGKHHAFVNSSAFPIKCNAGFGVGAGGFEVLHFFPSGEDLGDVCRNLGENASVIVHEFGHGLDRNDASGDFSNSSESYADIAALLRTQASCHAPGFFVSLAEPTCGMAADGSGPNWDEDQTGAAPYCTTNCSGTRDVDWAAHSPATPATALGFVCSSCWETPWFPGPCGREVHCAAAPSNQAAWDLVARDLTAPPFNLDRQSAFLVGSKIFYHGSGNIGSWFACTCGGSSNGCAAENAYVQWAAADDDNGNLLDGTPHLGALFAAFDRHGIACGTFPHTSSGCASGPTAVPHLTTTPGVMSIALSWNAVPAATRYWVYRTEGHAGCDYGKTLIAEVAGLAYVDTEVAGGRKYYYNVVAVGASTACYSRASNCASGRSEPLDFAVSCAPSTVTIAGTSGSGTTSCTVTTTGGFDTPLTLGCTGLPSGAGCAFTPGTLTPPGTASLRVSTLGLPAGTYPFQVKATPVGNPLGGRTTPMVLSVGSVGPDAVAAWVTRFQAPACLTAGHRSCDSGPTLLRGRGTLDPEANQPNTLLASCADGSAPVAPANGSGDRLAVATVDGVPLAAGAAVSITANVTARAAFAEDTADFFSAADARSPVWVLIGSVQPDGPGPQTLGLRFVLPTGAPLQAIRLQYRRDGTPVECSPGASDDHDDLVFAVGGAAVATSTR
jgi:trimeric autotransporter adhesin